MVSPGDKLLEIPNLNDFQGIIYINPSDNRFVQASDAVSLTLFALPETPLKGFVFRKENYPMTRNERLGKNDPEGSLEENKVFIEITDHDPVLRPGMSFKAEITSVIATDCLFVPRVGIQTDEASATFLLVKTPSGGKEKRLIKIGRSGISFVEVLSGLNRGENIALTWPEPEN